MKWVLVSSDLNYMTIYKNLCFNSRQAVPLTSSIVWLNQRCTNKAPLTQPRTYYMLIISPRLSFSLGGGGGGQELPPQSHREFLRYLLQSSRMRVCCMDCVGLELCVKLFGLQKKTFSANVSTARSTAEVSYAKKDVHESILL